MANKLQKAPNKANTFQSEGSGGGRCVGGYERVWLCVGGAIWGVHMGGGLWRQGVGAREGGGMETPLSTPPMAPPPTSGGCHHMPQGLPLMATGAVHHGGEYVRCPHIPLPSLAPTRCPPELPPCLWVWAPHSCPAAVFPPTSTCPLPT